MTSNGVSRRGERVVLTAMTWFGLSTDGAAPAKFVCRLMLQRGTAVSAKCRVPAFRRGAPRRANPVLRNPRRAPWRPRSEQEFQSQLPDARIAGRGGAAEAARDLRDARITELDPVGVIHDFAAALEAGPLGEYEL